ncbi:MAG: hypothetical protein RQ715_04965 [Methylococcales bacterium]|nr:hypothetical protein [Methylococcales bacterium]
MAEPVTLPPMGGYFQLELPAVGSLYHPDAMLYQSARAAFRALLKAAKYPVRIRLPKYICDAVLSAVVDENIDYIWYDLDETLNVPDSLQLNKGEWLFYVNYFGVCQDQVEGLLKRYPAKQLIFDFSQAFFDLPKLQALATIYSPRKFFGIPDGGMLVTCMELSKPERQDSYSQSRMTHLLKRLYQEPECAYSDYLRAEASLSDSTPMSMSGLTKQLLAAVDYQSIKQQRAANFAYLHARLKDVNEFVMDETSLIAPLCYPLMLDHKGLRERLLGERVFIPTYWRDAYARVSRRWSRKFIDGLLPLPIDQRYRQVDMDYLLSLMTEIRQ